MGMHVSSYSMNEYGDKEKKKVKSSKLGDNKTENMINVFIIKLIILNCDDEIMNLII